MTALTVSNAARPELLSGPSVNGVRWSPDSSWLAYRHSGGLWIASAGAEPASAARVCDGAH